MVMSAGRSQGMSTAHGADAVLRDAAEEVGKPVGGLESFEFQMGMFSKMPGATAAVRSCRSRPHEGRGRCDARPSFRRPGTAGDIESFAPMLDQMETALRRPIG